MSTSRDLRACGRIPIEKSVQVVTRGKAASYALAINISLGGLLLNAAPTLPVGSQCRLALPPLGESVGKEIVLEGTVIRSDANGTAVKFKKMLENGTLEAIAKQTGGGLGVSLATAYVNYFKVSQNRDFEGSQQLLGVSPGVFRKVFLATFTTCILLAILPVLLLKGSLLWAPNWAKVLLCFGYAAVWFAVIQPLADLAVFGMLKKRAFDS